MKKTNKVNNTNGIVPEQNMGENNQNEVVPEQNMGNTEQNVEQQVPEQEVVLDAGQVVTEAPQTPDPLQVLNEEITNLKKEREELIEKIKYSQAELVSYRMRKDEETASLLKYANQDIITEILPLIDNFENAIKLASQSNNPEITKYLTGFQLMYQNLIGILNKYGVEEINRVGQVYDSKQEQAMVADNDPSQPDEVVLEVLQKGYKLKDRVIRPASVRVNQL